MLWRSICCLPWRIQVLSNQETSSFLYMLARYFFTWIPHHKLNILRCSLIVSPSYSQIKQLCLPQSFSISLSFPNHLGSITISAFSASCSISSIEAIIHRVNFLSSCSSFNTPGRGPLIQTTLSPVQYTEIFSRASSPFTPETELLFNVEDWHLFTNIFIFPNKHIWKQMKRDHHLSSPLFFFF